MTALAVAPDGTWLATGDEAGALRVWDLPSGALRCTLPDPAAAPVTAIVIATDGTRFAATCDDGSMRTWDQTTGAAGITFVGHAATRLAWHPPVSQQDYRFGHTGRDTVWAVAIAPDATWVATAESDRLTRIWETSTGDVLARLRVRSGPLRKKAATLAVAIAPDGRWLTTADSDGAIRIWDITHS